MACGAQSPYSSFCPPFNSRYGCMFLHMISLIVSSDVLLVLCVRITVFADKISLQILVKFKHKCSDCHCVHSRKHGQINETMNSCFLNELSTSTCLLFLSTHVNDTADVCVNIESNYTEHTWPCPRPYLHYVMLSIHTNYYHTGWISDAREKVIWSMYLLIVTRLFFATWRGHS